MELTHAELCSIFKDAGLSHTHVDYVLKRINALFGSPRKVGEDGANELLRVLKAALKQTSCDGDLCMYEWHEDARRIINEVEEAARPSSEELGVESHTPSVSVLYRRSEFTFQRGRAMSEPFEKFKVFVSMSNNRDALCQTCFVEAALEHGTATDMKIFIEDAINEKLKRAPAPNTGGR